MGAVLTGTLLLALVIGPACVSGRSCGAIPTPGASTQSSPRQLPALAPAARVVEAGTALHEYSGGARPGDAVPLVVAIHGLGDRPESFRRLFQGFPGRAHFVFPAGDMAWGDGLGWWPIPGEIKEDNMAPGLDAAAARLAARIRLWASSGIVGKPIVTGFSQGGMLSFALAVKFPNEIGEALPAGGLLPPSMLPASWPAGTARPRIVALHGGADDVVPHAFGKTSADNLRALGLDVEWRSYAGLTHWISADVRKDLFAALSASVGRTAALERWAAMEWAP